MNEVGWNYFNKFDKVNEKYLPAYGEGETLAEQIVTAVNKLIYKWFNDGDVYDNVNSCMDGWCNDLSSYANWLHEYADGCDEILDEIFEIYTDRDYEFILAELADLTLNENYLSSYIEEKIGTIYECYGPYEFNEYSDEDEYE
ncbi:MAG: hypothetical protein MJY95_08215 [Bacteroidaceae bacterium]|nr:hypothetical protein [Bacteroidaceae bacterium]